MSRPRRAARTSEPAMDFQQPFSVLNERLRPRVAVSEQLYSSLNRLEDRKLASFRSTSSPYQTVLPDPPAPETQIGREVSVDRADGPEERGYDDLVDGDTCLITEMKIKDVDEDSISSKSDEKDASDELSSEWRPGTPESEGTFQRGVTERSLPDLIKTGRPLGRRRTVGHVSQTLKEVRREVELSRRRSIRLKAQVDKLQERREGPGWSQDRERVTEEVLSVLRLLFPLTDASFKQPELLDGGNRLDDALDQLQKVARSLAVGHTAKQEFRSGKDGSEESAILQQALRDRDEAIEKKKAMEAELLRSRTEMMVLNNQVLEAAQKRLEMSLELEAWKEDFQLLLHQQVQAQQLAEQNQKKSSRGLGLLRRNRTPVQRPAAFPLQPPAPAYSNSSRLAAPVSPKPAASAGGTWKNRLRRGKPSRLADQDVAGNDSDYSRDDDGFQVVSLD